MNTPPATGLRPLLAAGLLGALGACGQSDPPATTPLPVQEHQAEATHGRRIDVHAHLLPDFYYDSLIAHGHASGGGGVPTPRWSPESALSFMDRYGIQAQVVSISEPGVYYLPTAQERLDMAVRINDYIRHELIDSQDSRRAGRFGGMAVLPLGDLGQQEVADAGNEAVRALTGLGLDGVGLFTSYNDVYLGDPRLDPLMRTLDSLGAVVFVHPVVPAALPNTGTPAFLTEFTFETTRAAVKMLYSGVYLRYPRIRWLLSHAGGTLPFVSGRSSLLLLIPPLATNLENLGLHIEPPQAYARLYYDTALAQERAPMLATRTITSVDHILLGTDWPYSGITFLIPGHPAPLLKQSFDEAELGQVERGNALVLFPGLASRVAP